MTHPRTSQAEAARRNWADPVFRARVGAKISERQRTRFTPEMDAVLRELAARVPRVKWTAVADRLGVTVDALRYRRRELGVERPPSAPRGRAG